MSANLGAPQVSSSQTGKTATINDAVSAIDAAITEVLAVDATTIPLNLTLQQVRSAAVLVFSGNTAPGNVNIPPCKRILYVHNKGSAALTVAVGTGQVVVAPAAIVSVYADGTINGLYALTAGTGGGGGTTPTGHKAWRIKIATAHGNGQCSVATLQLRQTTGGADLTQTAGGTPFADGTIDNNTGTYGPSMAFDNNANTWWVAHDGTLPHYLGYNFTSAQIITEIALQTRNDSNYAYMPLSGTVQYSDDTTTGLDGTWTDSFTYTTGDTWTSGETRVFTHP